MRRAPLDVRFWEKVDKNGPVQPHMTTACWLWLGYRRSNGYGEIYDPTVRGPVCVHRVSWRLHHGAPAGDMFVCHRCDNPSCVRPDHLFLGTNDENVRDMLAKGRSLKGARHPLALLTEADVPVIRQLRQTMTGRAVAKLYGVSDSAISKIIRGDHWKHVA